jgi:hypothetical protein
MRGTGGGGGSTAFGGGTDGGAAVAIWIVCRRGAIPVNVSRRGGDLTSICDNGEFTYSRVSRLQFMTHHPGDTGSPS